MRLSRPVARPEEESFWTSFTDVMSSMVFVLFFFIVILVIRQLITAEVWDARLIDADAALSAKQRQLEAANNSLEAVNSELAAKRAEISEMERSLSEREVRIDELQAQLDKGQAALILKEKELAEVNARLQDISVLRLSILKRVKDSIEAEVGAFLDTGGEPLVSIDDNANLVVNSSLLFAKGSSEISPGGYSLLEKFSAAFGSILADPYVRNNIDSIVVSGYADSDDSYDNNYYLSCERAVAVITAMMEKNPVLCDVYGSYFQASGFSEFRPVAEGDDEEAMSRNRRIQISVNVKDSSLQKIIDEYEFSGQ